MTIERLNSPDELEILRKNVLSKRDPEKTCISVCMGTGCIASGASEVVATLKTELKTQGLDNLADVRTTGCHGFCEKGPIAVIDPEEICYLEVTPKDVSEIVSSTLAPSTSKEKKIIDRLLYTDHLTGKKVTFESDIPFYKNQERLIFGANRLIDPKSLDDYLAIGGYKALVKALFKMTPQQVIQEVKDSGLKGRGGAGFPTGVKWEFASKAPGNSKYVIVNCDEGDPGAYMDRSLMEGNPFAVLEGLLIGAYAIGANEGYIYIRQEYPLALSNLDIAIKIAKARNLLGSDILGSGFNFNVKVHKGAGAFVCGEETALLRSLEGKPGEPTPRPPYPAVKGLWNKPTNINNVETWANIPLIINEGSKKFSSTGTETSKGTKIFSLVGKISNTGLVEVPMGISLRDVVYKIGGGIPDGKKFKAIQTGGPSGGCIPEERLDITVGFAELTAAGSMMGSGGMIVMDEDTCMPDVARYFIDFLTNESCGKCVPCREGLRQMHRILTDITQGKGKEGDIEKLEELAETAMEASLCALGKSAPNPFLSTLRYFRDEYEAHIKEKRCPALSCKELISFYIDPDKCQGCMICKRKCPVDAIDGGKKMIHIIDQDKCTKCEECFEACPTKFGAVQKISGKPVPSRIAEENRTNIKKRTK